MACSLKAGIPVRCHDPAIRSLASTLAEKLGQTNGMGLAAASHCANAILVEPHLLQLPAWPCIGCSTSSQFIDYGPPHGRADACSNSHLVFFNWGLVEMSVCAFVV
jgi:hypothetical protein